MFGHSKSSLPARAWLTCGPAIAAARALPKGVEL
jgi:hypothetical protein